MGKQSFCKFEGSVGPWFLEKINIRPLIASASFQEEISGMQNMQSAGSHWDELEVAVLRSDILRAEK